MIPQLKDQHFRDITYLRLSVTDRCQFKCVYCVPPEGMAALPKKDLMTPDEMERLVRALAQMGVWRLRVTGGEPLLRPDIVSLIARFKAVPGITDLALSTNGEHLADVAPDLKQAGLQRVNISMDSLDPKRFQAMTQSSAFEKVWAGVHKALAVGLQVKLNVVAMPGITPADIDAFASLAYHHPLEVRFIEFMPLCGSGWSPDQVLPIEFIRSRILKKYSLSPRFRGSEVAESFDLEGGSGRVGFIASMTEPFCTQCSRIRISATGKMLLCLFSKLEYNLLPILRSNASLEGLQEEIRHVTLKKPEQHPYSGAQRLKREAAHGQMQAIGG